jgi:hypothetical protein
VDVGSVVQQSMQRTVLVICNQDNFHSLSGGPIDCEMWGVNRYVQSTLQDQMVWRAGSLAQGRQKCTDLVLTCRTADSVVVQGHGKHLQ